MAMKKKTEEIPYLGGDGCSLLKGLLLELESLSWRSKTKYISSVFSKKP
jgi:hypothetical protein